MTSGTKIILAVITLFVGILVVYYGFVMPDGDGPDSSGSPAAVVSGNDEASADAANVTGRDADDADRDEEGDDGSWDDAPGDAAARRAAEVARIASQRTAVTATPERAETNSTSGSSDPAIPPVLPRDAASLGAIGEAPTLGDDESMPMKPAGAPEMSTPPAPAAGSSAKPLDTTPGTPRENAAGSLSGASPTKLGSPDRTTPSAGAARNQRPNVVYTLYTVKGGDSLSSIAQSFYGDHRKWELIAKANPVDPNRLRIGQRLRLPPRDSASASGSSNAAPRAASPKRAVYVVRAGDTLSSIAKAEYGDSSKWKTIFASNRGTIGSDPNVLAVGMELQLPAK